MDYEFGPPFPDQNFSTKTDLQSLKSGAKPKVINEQEARSIGPGLLLPKFTARLIAF